MADTKAALNVHSKNVKYKYNGEIDQEWLLTTKSTIIINEHGNAKTVRKIKENKKRHGDANDDDECDILIVHGKNWCDEIDGKRCTKENNTELMNETWSRCKLNSFLDIGHISAHRRKLVIHFDIRNTVLVADSVTNVSVEQALNSFLTGVTWGSQCSTGDWTWHSSSPSLTPPNSDAITYYKYLEKQLVRTPSVRAKLRLATGEFTEQDIGEGFQSIFQKHLALLQWNHQITPGYEKLTMAGKDGSPYHYILPSVYKVIHWLKQTKRDYAIIFRTYGLDAANVLASLSFGLNGHHPGFPKMAMKVNHRPGRISRSHDGLTLFETFNEITGDMSEKRTGDRQGYELMSKATGISAYVDDFPHWQNRWYHHSAGKPFYIDLFDTNTQHILFDDNFRPFEDDSIVDVKLFESKGSSKARSLSKTEIAKYQKSCLVQANLLDSIENEDYFTNAVQLCERNYNELLADRASQIKKRKLSV